MWIYHLSVSSCHIPDIFASFHNTLLRLHLFFWNSIYFRMAETLSVFVSVKCWKTLWHFRTAENPKQKNEMSLSWGGTGFTMNENRLSTADSIHPHCIPRECVTIFYSAFTPTKCIFFHFSARNSVCIWCQSLLYSTYSISAKQNSSHSYSSQPWL